MFFVISKILKVFIYPLTWIVGLFVLSFLLKNKKKQKICFMSAIVVLLLFSDKPLMQYAQYLSTKSYNEQQIPKRHYGVGVIMGGFARMNTSTGQLDYIEDRGARLWETLRLYHAGVVDKIMISGDATIAVDKDGNSKADSFLAYLQDMGVSLENVILEQKARNTTENAEFCIAILDSLGYEAPDCLIVTSATHLKRSLKCFEKSGWTVDGYAVNIYSKPHPKLYEFIPNWKALTDWREVLNEWFGGIVYNITGK